VPVDDVVPRPERLVGRDGHHEQAARPRHAPQLRQRGAVVGRVLDDVEARHEVERPVREGQVLDARDAHVAVPAPPRRGDRLGARVDPRRAPEARELVERPARAAAGVEQPRARRDRKPVELGPQDAAAPAVPPVALVARQHGLQLVGRHGRDARRAAACAGRASRWDRVSAPGG
jgi:hypothetical protein